MGTYLDSHPQTNQALTTISQQQAGPQSLGSVKTYFDANPQAAKDMQQLQQPLVNLSTRCKLPVSLPQLMGLDAGRAAAGRRHARRFARSTADGADDGRSRRGIAGVAVTGFGGNAGRRAASRTRDHRHPLALSVARSVAGEAAELRFQTFS